MLILKMIAGSQLNEIFAKYSISSAAQAEIIKEVGVIVQRRDAVCGIRQLLNHLPGMAYHCANLPGLWTMEYVSDGCTELTGYIPEEIMFDKRISFYALIDPLYKDYIQESWDAAIAENRYVRLEYPIVTATGEKKWVWEHGIALYDEAGKITGFEGFVLDISERRDLVRELELAMKELKLANEEAERATQTKNQFLANINHEMRNPATIIIALLEDLLQSELAEGQQQLVQQIYGQINHLVGIMGDILNIEKMLRHGVVLSDSNFHIRDLTKGLESNRVSARAKGLTFETQIDPLLEKYELKGDISRLTQILTNFITNALKFTEAGGVIVRINLEKEFNNRVTIMFLVEDTGIGIKPADQGKLFREFSRITHEHKVYQGTGLGLAITKMIVEAMKGTLIFASTPDVGSTFGCSLSLEFIETPIPTIQKIPNVKKWPVLPLHILVADDEGIILMDVRRKLEKQKYTVDTACDGQEALQKCLDNDYDLVFMDSGMPHLKGYQVVQQLRAAGKKFPVIALSGASDETSQRLFEQAGANWFVDKPYRDQALIEALCNVIPREESAN